HEHEPGTASLHDLEHLRVSPGGDVVDDQRSRLDGGGGDLALGGVDRDDGAVAGQGLDHWQYPALLGSGVDRFGSGAGRLASDVDDVGAGSNQGPAVGDGVGGIGEEATVREGVRCDVDHGHEPGSVERQPAVV